MPRVAVIAVTTQYPIASVFAFLFYPNVTITSGFTDPISFRAVFITYIVGFAILVPGFYYFWSIFMGLAKKTYVTIVRSG